MADVLMWVAIALGFGVALPSFWLLGAALSPRKAALRLQAAGGSLLLSTMIGLIPVGLAIGILTRAGKLGPLGALVALLAGAVLLYGWMGAGGLAQRIGTTLWPTLTATQPWKQVLRGGLILIGCALLPGVGWFLVLPLMAVTGWGIQIRSWFIRAAPVATDPAS